MNVARAPMGSQMGVRIHPGRERDLSVEHWLLSAAPVVKEATWSWAETGLAVLRCGGIFAAVRIPAPIVHAAAGADDPAHVRRFLEGGLDGPVFADQLSHCFYALVPASTARQPLWRGDRIPAVCLGEDSFLGVPRPGRDDPGRSRSYWVVPMEAAGVLCAPEAVLALVERGQRDRAEVTADDE
ncbi:hypothetical protein [Streptomyces sp. BH104]|uniref:hypothetical protein n=1 Tax=Streptomyces sp. BH104 TaxID=3410407 RepID=UPI003BB780C8